MGRKSNRVIHVKLGDGGDGCDQVNRTGVAAKGARCNTRPDGSTAYDRANWRGFGRQHPTHIGGPRPGRYGRRSSRNQEGEGAAVGSLADLVQRKARLDGTGLPFKHPIATLGCIASHVDRTGDIRPRQRGQCVGGKAADFALSKVAPVNQNICVGRQGGLDDCQFIRMFA